MAIIWDLQLRAYNTEDAEKINSYAKELNKEYGFELRKEEDFSGMVFNETGFYYSQAYGEMSVKFEKFINAVVAHFPEMKLKFIICGDGPNYQSEFISKNGTLQHIEPWFVRVHCNKEYFTELSGHTNDITALGFDFRIDEANLAIGWEYDHLTEEEQVKDIIQQISKAMPNAELTCYNFINLDNCSPVEQFCRVKNGEGSWKKASNAIEDMVWEVITENTTFSVFDVIEDPKSCVKQLLATARNGKDGAQITLANILKENYFECLQPCDKQWLWEMERRNADLVLLKGMNYSERTWEETFKDEETGEEAVIERREVLNTPVFDKLPGEEEEIYRRILDGHIYPYEYKDTVEYIKYWTSLDYTLLMQQIDIEEKEKRYAETRPDVLDNYQWLYEEYAELYRWGREEFGYFIDKQKAAEYYRKAGITDENPLEDE